MGVYAFVAVRPLAEKTVELSSFAILFSHDAPTGVFFSICMDFGKCDGLSSLHSGRQFVYGIPHGGEFLLVLGHHIAPVHGFVAVQVVRMRD